MSPSLQLLFEFVLVLFPIFLLLLISFKLRASSRKTKLPPCPPKLPFIGNLHQLGSLPHRSLRALAEKHGPLMLPQLGQVPTLVVSSAEMAREIMRTHDLIFASRPYLKAAKDLFNGGMDMAFAPYCDYWRQARKICALHLLSAKKVNSFGLAREEEVAVMLRKISRACPSPDPVNLSEILFSFAKDMLCRTVTGNFVREGGRNDLFRELIEENTSLVSGFHVEDCFPSLAWLEVPFGLGARAKRNAERWNHVLDEVFEDHDARMKGDHEKANNFADVLLCLQKDPKVEFALTEENIKAILIDMFTAGIDTTYITLEWAMAELARNSEVMAKLQDELRGVAKGKGSVGAEDLSEASYLNAVMKEVLRLHPPLPLIPRETLDDCRVQGYDIPKRTRVMVNAWAINRDPKCWEAPEEFRPERFMGTQVDFKGNDFRFIPFGAGRRICPGMSFAVSTVELALGKLVHRFDWKLPHGMAKEDLDMTDAPGITTPRKQRLHLVAKPCAATTRACE